MVRHWDIRVVGLLAGYVIGASILGLRGHPYLILSVWSSNILADLVFVAGTVATGAAAYQTARRSWWQLSVLVAFLLSWTVYAVSFYVLGVPQVQQPFSFGPEGFSGLRSGSLGYAFSFTLEFGFVGLAFSTIAPAAASYVHGKD